MRRLTNLDKTKKFKTLFIKGNTLIRYEQDGMFFNCGGWPVIDGKVYLPGMDVPEAAVAAQGQYICPVCDRDCKKKKALDLHMEKVHPKLQRSGSRVVSDDKATADKE
jgi:ssDNA-binding Zn-finger/Zn-ribbon topoisomerase 1